MVFPRPGAAFLSAFVCGGNYHFLWVSEVTLGSFWLLFGAISVLPCHGVSLSRRCLFECFLVRRKTSHGNSMEFHMPLTSVDERQLQSSFPIQPLFPGSVAGRQPLILNGLGWVRSTFRKREDSVLSICHTTCSSPCLCCTVSGSFRCQRPLFESQVLIILQGFTGNLPALCPIN